MDKTEMTENIGERKRYTWISFYKEMANKLLAFKDNRHELVDIVYESGKANYITATDQGRVSDIDPFTVYGVFNRNLTNENRIELAKYFKKRLGIEADVPTDFDGIPIVNNLSATFFAREEENTAIQPLWDLFESVVSEKDEGFSEQFNIALSHKGLKWNLTMALYWIRPYEFIGLDSRNREYLSKLKFDVFNEKNLTAENYMTLLDQVKEKIRNKEIKEESIPEISYNAWVRDDPRSYWLAGFTFSGEISQLDQFLNEGYWEGRFNPESKSDQKLIKLAKEINKGDILILKSTSTKGENHDQPFMRVKTAGIVKGAVETTEEDGMIVCHCKVDYVPPQDKDFDGNHYGSYRKTIHKLDESLTDVVSYINELFDDIDPEENMKTEKYQEYIDLLKTNHNLVLTGAPGTGKTYMARAIAKEMGCGDDEVQFVQFHPSYDYTDFVEGLRPVSDGSGQIGFERRDGVFKEFCRKAWQNLEDSRKSAEVMGKELSWRERLEDFVNDAIEKEKSFKTVNKSEFRILEMRDNTITVYNGQNNVAFNVIVNVTEILRLLSEGVRLDNVSDIRAYFNRKYGSQADSYSFVIATEVRKMKVGAEKVAEKVVRKKDFVFIIDEINRGEASKIFGELFYAIDPGYRGNTEMMVKTQYQNLIPETDVFYKGFFVPENVYIIGTMNDIDRSVESMDFAMRRRFTWKEVSPDDTSYMLDKLKGALPDKAKACLQRLNKSISETDGLGAAYQIGPSYFLKLETNGGDFDALWKMSIEPLLREYLRGMRRADETLNKFKEVYLGTSETT